MYKFNSGIQPVNSLTLKMINPMVKREARGSVAIKALCYKPEGRGFDSQ
jgi:hypothetical protein